MKNVHVIEAHVLGIIIFLSTVVDGAAADFLFGDSNGF